MKFFTNKNVIQKIVISIVLVISLNFSMPVKVNADVGGTLLSPIFALVTVIFDIGQYVLEWAMLGETSFPMKENTEENRNVKDKEDEKGAKVDISELGEKGKDLDFDGEVWGMGDYRIPVIKYSPEEIFSNKVPALDINFINPTKTGNEKLDKRNIAAQIQPVISSWYIAIRTLSIVGLLSVLLYLGIRILLTSVAADRAKYKNMIFDWVVAMCLVISLHYIMSFVLTLVETVTSMMSSGLGQTVTVYVPDGTVFNTNLIGFVRFMIQCTDIQQKVTFLFLYLMLLIYSFRFTWVYLKRVANMAFLTLIAPFVALTYPIDKISDGKAQAFNMWIKEFTFNALIQPLHLLIYTVLVGSAIQLAVDNPIYPIVCLGFILAAEKLLKKMFGFEKASGGTVGSLAGAAGVTAIAGKALNTLASGRGGNKSNGGKVRTKENLERVGRDNNGNAPFRAFQNATSPDNMIGANAGAPLPQENGQQGTQTDVGGTLPQGSEQEGTRTDGGGTLPQGSEQQGTQTDVGGTLPQGSEQEETQTDGGENNIRQSINDNDEVEQEETNSPVNNDNNSVTGLNKPKRSIRNSKIGRNTMGALRTIPTGIYKGVRGTLKTATRAGLAVGAGAVGLAIGATTGDGDKAIAMAAGAAGIAAATGGNLFESTLGSVMKDKSVQDSYGAGKYGNAIDARNAKADNQYLKSQQFDEFYEKNYKGKKDVTGKNHTKKQMRDTVRSYRQAGITSEKDIKRAIKLEDKYRKDNPNLSEKDCREQVQNIVQSFGEMDINKRAFAGDENVKQAEIKRIAGMLGDENTASNKQMAAQIFQGFSDWRDI